ncbi:hypothetical protein V5O48_015442 [Marasmius crinis-equi]|uniref:AB hydrolase-1 domain-containing protein n=1 Tax=Marasmius crinis-equi TaxID=585013 RepID=A0ABR3EUI0_9AGAR
MDSTGSIVVDDKGTTLSYRDSGAASTPVYTTFFVIHGLGFTSAIFSRIADQGRLKGLRIVAINRRGYKGSTPYSPEEIAELTEGDDKTKAAFWKMVGMHVAIFIYQFIQKESPPPVLSDFSNGGVVLLGWSAGSTFSAATIAHIDSLPEDVQRRLTSYICGHIIQELSRVPYNQLWLTSYFDHGDLSTRNLDVLEYMVPSADRAPSMYNMSKKEKAEFIEASSETNGFELAILAGCFPQLNAIYKKALFGKTQKQRFSGGLKTTFIVGDRTLSLVLAALWSVQDDDRENGGGNVKSMIIAGAITLSIGTIQRERSMPIWMHRLSQSEE